MSMGQRGNRRTKVLEFRDAETTAYAILSHRWIDPTEVDCEEIINLAKMDVEEQNEIRGRLGYKKILDTCEQAKRDGYKWVWVDTCCIDTRSSAELSEAIHQEIGESLLKLYITLPLFPCVSTCIILIHT